MFVVGQRRIPPKQTIEPNKNQFLGGTDLGSKDWLASRLRSRHPIRAALLLPANAANHIQQMNRNQFLGGTDFSSKNGLASRQSSRHSIRAALPLPSNAANHIQQMNSFRFGWKHRHQEGSRIGDRRGKRLQRDAQFNFFETELGSSL